MAKRKLFVVAVVLFILLPITKLFAEESNPAPEESLLDDLKLEQIETYWNNLNETYDGFLPDIEKSSVYEFIKNKESFSFKNILISGLQFLFFELIANGKLLGQLLLLAILSAILRAMHNSFLQSTIHKISQFVIYLVLLFIVLNSFHLSFSYTKNAIDSMNSFMIALLPLLLGLMASFGNIFAVSFFHPILIFIIYSSGPLIGSIVLPLLLIACFIQVINGVNKEFRMHHLARLIKTVALWIMGGFLTIFITLLSVQGTVAAVEDGVAMKATKFITGNFIPVIGRALTDATDSIFSASLLLKNAVGVIGLAIVGFIALFPVLKILAIAFIYKISAALLEPISDSALVDALNIVGKYMLYILGALITVAMMFFLAIVIITLASNVTVFLR